jgi:hypothetical protein
VMTLCLHPFVSNHRTDKYIRSARIHFRQGWSAVIAAYYEANDLRQANGATRSTRDLVDHSNLQHQHRCKRPGCQTSN